MTTRRELLRAAGPLAAAAGVLGACAGGSGRTAPLYNVEGREFVGGGSLGARANQIRRAGAGLGWDMREVGPGLIRGTLNIRSHQAVVDIPYDARRFSIRYVSSQNLNYDGSVIHSNYNGWIQRLEREIVAQPPV